jgi:hypothetical protein
MGAPLSYDTILTELCLLVDFVLMTVNLSIELALAKALRTKE